MGLESPEGISEVSAQCFLGSLGDYALTPLLEPHRTRWGCDPQV